MTSSAADAGWGLGLAFLSAFLFGFYMVPRKPCRLKDGAFMMSMVLGAAFGAVVGSTTFHIPLRLDWQDALLCLACGPFWVVAVMFYTASVGRVGLAVSTPIKNTTAVLGTLAGIFIFGEWRTTAPLPCILGSILVVLCAVFAAAAAEGQRWKTRSLGMGALWAVLAAFFFALYAIPFKVALGRGVPSSTVVVWMTLGAFLSVAGWFLFQRDGLAHWKEGRTRDHLYAALAGVLWVAGVFSMGAAIRRIGLAVTWPISNLNTVVTVLAGIILFREIDLRRHGVKIASALAAAAAGGILLGLSRR